LGVRVPPGLPEDEMAIDNQRIALYSFVGLGLVVWFVLWRLFGSIVELLFPGEIILGIPLENLLSLLAAGITALIGVLVWRNEQANRFSGEVIVELKKVSWPNWKELRGSTIVVGIMTLIVALILWIFDKIFDSAMKLLL
jgi:preprotein translocase subunit SecE